ncbi:Mzb1 [Symbiodinium microadriaticum]|nr:Mzb1 [Symbiodinium microadriaticum]
MQTMQQVQSQSGEGSLQFGGLKLSLASSGQRCPLSRREKSVPSGTKMVFGLPHWGPGTLRCADCALCCAASKVEGAHSRARADRGRSLDITLKDRPGVSNPQRAVSFRILQVFAPTLRRLRGPMSRTGLKKVAFGKPDTGILFWPRLEAGLGRLFRVSALLLVAKARGACRSELETSKLPQELKVQGVRACGFVLLAEDPSSFLCRAMALHFQHGLQRLVLATFIAAAFAADKGKGGWEETVNEEGKKVQSLKIEAPAMTEEAFNTWLGELKDYNDRAIWQNAEEQLLSDEWMIREITDNHDLTTMRQGSVARNLRPIVYWTGSSLQTNAMHAMVTLQSQVDSAVTMLSPYSQYLSLKDYFAAASPTDFRKCISAMGAEDNGWTIPAAQALGALAVRKTTTDAKMVTIYRKLVKNELAARMVLGAQADPAGGGAGPDQTDGNGDRLWRDFAANPLPQPLVGYLLYGQLPVNWPGAGGGLPAYPGQQAIPVIYFLGQTLGFTVGPLNAYPTLATIATANLKFLLATACNTDFAYALMAEIGELLGFIPMPVCRELAPGGAGPRNLAPAVAGGNIPDGKRPNYAGRLETRVWTAWDTEAYAYAPLFDISAANVVEAYQTFQQCEDAFLVSKVDRTLCNIAGMFQMGYRTNVCGANFNTGVNGPPAASMAGLRRLNLSNTNFVDGSAYGAFIGQYRVISTPVHVYILISMDYGEQMIACLQHISLTATTDDRSWGAIISDDSPVAYIPLWHCRKKSGRQLEQYFIPTYAQVKSWSERAAVIMGRMIQLGIPIKTVGAADVYAYVLEMENEGADFIQAIMCLSAVLQGVRANNGRNDRWVSTRALEITVQGVSASSSRRRVQRRRHPPRPRRGPPRAKAVARDGLASDDCRALDPVEHDNRMRAVADVRPEDVTMVMAALLRTMAMFIVEASQLMMTRLERTHQQGSDDMVEVNVDDPDEEMWMQTSIDSPRKKRKMEEVEQLAEDEMEARTQREDEDRLRERQLEARAREEEEQARADEALFLQHEAARYRDWEQWEVLHCPVQPPRRLQVSLALNHGDSAEQVTRSVPLARGRPVDLRVQLHEIAMPTGAQVEPPCQMAPTRPMTEADYMHVYHDWLEGRVAETDLERMVGSEMVAMFHAQKSVEGEVGQAQVDAGSAPLSTGMAVTAPVEKGLEGLLGPSVEGSLTLRVGKEDQYGYNMPDRYKCDSCRAVIHHLNEGYGIKLVNGENVLSGPALKDNAELQPGMGAIQMGGDTWKKRLAEICRKLVFEEVGEEETYDYIYGKYKANDEVDAKAFCLEEVRHCQPTRLGPQPPPKATEEASKEPKPKKATRRG